MMNQIDISSRSRLSYFKTLGLFVARALLDSRIIDVNLNKVFLKLLLGRPVKKSIAALKVSQVGLNGLLHDVSSNEEPCV